MNKLISFLMFITFINIIILNAQNDTVEIKLNKISIFNKTLPIKLGLSPITALPLNDLYFSEDFIDSSFIRDFQFNLTIGIDANISENKGHFRLKIDPNTDNIIIIADTDFDGSIFDEKQINLYVNEKKVITFKNGLSFSFKVNDIELVKQGITNGLYIYPNTAYKGITILNKKSYSFILRDNSMGLYFFLDSLKIGNLSLTSVRLNQPFELENQKYVFTKFNISKYSIQLVHLPLDHKMIGSEVGYYIDIESLKMKTKIDPNKNTLIYFWGIWCKPCINSFPNILKIYKEKDSLNLNVFFTSYCLDSIHIQKSEDFVQKRNIDTLHFENKLKIGNSFNAIPWVSNYSLETMLGIFTYPSYVLLSKSGKILYNDYKLDLKALKKLIFQNQ